MKIEHSIAVNSILGEKSRIDGDLRVEGAARIDGDLAGNLDSSGWAQIGRQARIRGDVSAQSVVSGGAIEGCIIARDSVVLLESAVVLGDIFAKSVQIEEGAFFNGAVSKIKDDAAFERAKSEIAARRAFQKN